MQRHCVLQWGNHTYIHIHTYSLRLQYAVRLLAVLIVVKKAGTSLFALDWIKAFKVDVNELLYHNTPTTLSSTIDCNDEYPAVFAPGLGLCTKVNARLLLKDDAVPKFV